MDTKITEAVPFAKVAHIVGEKNSNRLGKLRILG
jgi:hypothetical protein